MQSEVDVYWKAKINRRQSEFLPVIISTFVLSASHELMDKIGNVLRDFVRILSINSEMIDCPVRKNSYLFITVSTIINNDMAQLKPTCDGTRIYNYIPPFEVDPTNCR